MVRVAVAGASGYMGAELLRLLLVHPRVSVSGVTSDRLAGEPLARAYPHLRGLCDLRFHDLDAEWVRPRRRRRFPLAPPRRGIAFRCSSGSPYTASASPAASTCGALYQVT